MTQSAVEIDEAAAGRGGTVRVVIQPLGVAHVVAASRNGGRAGVGSDDSGGLDEGGARVGAEVWLLAVLDRAGEPMPWNTVRAGPGWVLRSDPSATVSTAIVAADRTELMLDAVQDAQLVFLRHSWSGPVQVEVEDSPAPRMQVFDLHHDGYERLVVNLDEIGRERGPGDGGALAGGWAVDVGVDGVAAADPVAEQDRVFLARCEARRPTVVAVCCPRWLGASSATRTLFEDVYNVPADRSMDPMRLPAEVVDRHARTLVDSGAEHFVFSGGDACQLEVLRRVKAERPRARCDLLWHASYVQFSEDYTWRLFMEWVRASRNGEVDVIATVKAGQERLLRSLGVPSAFLLNRPASRDVEDPPELSDAADGELRVGLWLSGDVYRKLPHAVLSSLKLIPGAVLHSAGLSARSAEVASFLNVAHGLRELSPLPRGRLMREIRHTHVTAYVTFSECCPMVPFESMGLGVPCVLGPTSHLFEDDRLLFDALVVGFPDRADAIAERLVDAGGRRREIIDAYRRWLPGYIDRSELAMSAFLSM